MSLCRDSLFVRRRDFVCVGQWRCSARGVSCDCKGTVSISAAAAAAAAAADDDDDDDDDHERRYGWPHAVTELLPYCCLKIHRRAVLVVIMMMVAIKNDIIIVMTTRSEVPKRSWSNWKAGRKWTHCR